MLQLGLIDQFRSPLTIETVVNGRKEIAALPDNASLRLRLSFIKHIFFGRTLNLIVAVMLDLFICGMLFSVIERVGPIRGQYWAVITGFTVGYGDYFPKHTASRGVAVFLIVTMAMLMLALTGRVITWFIPNVDIWSNEEQEELKQNIEMLKQNLEELRDAQQRQLAVIERLTAQLESMHQANMLLIRLALTAFPELGASLSSELTREAEQLLEPTAREV
jgi:hypothetical protein